MDHQRREARIEANWKLFRMTSMMAAGVMLVVLLGIDAMFRFSSVQLNVTLGLLALAFLALFKLDFWLHQMTRILRKRHTR